MGIQGDAVLSTDLNFPIGAHFTIISISSNEETLSVKNSKEKKNGNPR